MFNKTNRFAIFTLLLLAFIVNGCNESNESIEVLETSADQLIIDKESVALDVLSIMQNGGIRENVVRDLKQSTMSLKTMVEGLTTHDLTISDAVKNLKLVLIQSELTMASQFVEVPELWLHTPKTPFDVGELLISYAPKGDESEWSEIVAYNLAGDKVILDKDEAPEVPVLVIETRGHESLKVEAALMNEKLRSAGLQSNYLNKALRTTAEDVETTKLDRISISETEESWILGDAEIYVITSGVRVADVQDEELAPEIAIIPLDYLDDEDTNYYPNQLVLFWDDYDYQAANIQVFERDENHSWEELIVIIIDGVLALVDEFVGVPWLSLLGDLASAIIGALPDEWYINSDDYVDSFYTIEKGQTYTNYYGAGGNASVDLSPYLLQAN